MRKLEHEEIPRLDPKRLPYVPRHPITVVVENVRSAHNVGSIFRTSDAALVEHVYLTGYSATPSHKAMRKTSLSAEGMVPWTQVPEAVPLLRDLKATGYTLVALEITDTPTNVVDLAPDDFPLVLILGNEVFGVSDEVLELCDYAIEIPQFGAKQSLNVSVAFGVAVYDLVRHVRTRATSAKRE